MSWSIKNVDSSRWETVAMQLCEKGIREKFVQNPVLMQHLINKTGKKTIVESANDTLWGTGVTLADETCLDKNRWITQGSLGCILENIRSEFATAVPMPPHMHRLAMGCSSYE